MYRGYLSHFVQWLPSPFCIAIALSASALYPDSLKPFLFQYCTTVPSSLSSCKAATLSTPRYSSSPLPSCTAAILSSHGCALVQQLPSPPKLCTEATLSYPTLYNTGATLSYPTLNSTGATLSSAEERVNCIRGLSPRMGKEWRERAAWGGGGGGGIWLGKKTLCAFPPVPFTHPAADVESEN